MQIQPQRAASIAATSIFFMCSIASNVRLATTGSGSVTPLRQRDRRDLPRQSPSVSAPAALALLTVVTDDRVPIAIRLRLIRRGYLKRKGLAVLHPLSSVQPQARNAEHGKLDGQHICGCGKRPLRCATVQGHSAGQSLGSIFRRRQLHRLFATRSHPPPHRTFDDVGRTRVGPAVPGVLACRAAGHANGRLPILSRMQSLSHAAAATCG